MAYNSEDSWEDTQQNPWAETGEPESLNEEEDGVAGGNRFEPETQDTELNVPADAKKAGDVQKPKKKIPKWQWGVLGGFVVIAMGGGGAFVFLDGHSSSEASMQQPMGLAHSPVSDLPQRTATPSIPQKSFPERPSHPEAPSAAMNTQVPVPSGGMSGFATLNQLSGSSPSTTSQLAPHTATTAEAVSPSPVSASSLSASATPIETPTTTTASPAVTSLQAPVVLSPTPTPTTPLTTTGLSAGASTYSPMAASAIPAMSPAVVRLKAEIAASKAKIAELQEALQSEKSTSAPRVVTRTIVRYVHVPVAAPAPSVTQNGPSSPSRTASGWSVVGGNGRVAMVSGPNGQVQSVRAGDVLPDGALVQQVGLGKVVTNQGIIR